MRAYLCAVRTLLILALVHMVSPATADSIRFDANGGYVDLVQVDGGPIIRFPGGNMERMLQVNEASMAAFQLFKDALAPSEPLPMLHNGLQNSPVPSDQAMAQMPIIFHGRILKIVEGRRNGDWYNVANHDRIVFGGYAAGDGEKTTGPAHISGLYVAEVLHDFDGPEDFIYAFSDRHVQAGVPFGSEAHRDSIYALFDPGGETLLRTGSGAAPEAKQEGRYTAFITEGSPSNAAYTELGGWDRHSPQRVPLLPIAVQPGGTIPLNFLDAKSLVIDAARARRYAAVPKDVDTLGRAATGLLCSMALAEPAFVSPAIRPKVQRAQNLGLTCLQDLLVFLQAYTDETFSRFYRPGYLEVGLTEAVDVTLDVIFAEEVFTVYFGADPVIRSTKNGSNLVPGPLGSLYDYSGDLIEALARVALQEFGWVTAPISQRARQAVIHLLAPDKMSRYVDAELFDVDRRYFRSALINYGLTHRATPTEQFWTLGVLCEAGWGHVDELRLHARGEVAALWGFAGRATLRGPHVQPITEEETSRAERAAQILARMMKESKGDGDRKETLPKWLQGHIEQSVEDHRGGRPEAIQAFLERLGKATDQISSCAG